MASFITIFPTEKMSLGWRAPTNLENRHRTEKPRVVPSTCSDWLGKETGKKDSGKDSGLHLLLPGPQGNVTEVSPALSSARTTVMYLVLLLTDGSVENGLQKVLDPEGLHGF